MLFPVVERKTGALPERLLGDHRALTEAIAAVEGSPSLETVARFHSVLSDHLDREELEVVPLLLQMPPHEALAILHG